MIQVIDLFAAGASGSCRFQVPSYKACPRGNNSMRSRHLANSLDHVASLWAQAASDH